MKERLYSPHQIFGAGDFSLNEPRVSGHKKDLNIYQSCVNNVVGDLREQPQRVSGKYRHFQWRLI